MSRERLAQSARLNVSLRLVRESPTVAGLCSPRKVRPPLMDDDLSIEHRNITARLLIERSRIAPLVEKASLLRQKATDEDEFAMLSPQSAEKWLELKDASREKAQLDMEVAQLRGTLKKSTAAELLDEICGFRDEITKNQDGIDAVAASLEAKREQLADIFEDEVVAENERQRLVLEDAKVAISRFCSDERGYAKTPEFGQDDREIAELSRRLEAIKKRVINLEATKAAKMDELEQVSRDARSQRRESGLKIESRKSIRPKSRRRMNSGVEEMASVESSEDCMGGGIRAKSMRMPDMQKIGGSPRRLRHVNSEKRISDEAVDRNRCSRRSVRCEKNDLLEDENEVLTRRRRDEMARHYAVQEKRITLKSCGGVSGGSLPVFEIRKLHSMSLEGVVKKTITRSGSF